jgi:hypothetical protein
MIKPFLSWFCIDDAVHCQQFIHMSAALLTYHIYSTDDEDEPVISCTTEYAPAVCTC